MTDWRTVPTEFPESHAELYDLLQEWFGLGSYDDATSGIPWWRARMTEIAKIRSLCRSRKASLEHMTIAAWYARENRIPVRSAHRLMPLIPDAMKTYRQALKERDREARELELNEAINQALHLGRRDWFDRLLRAANGDADLVLQEWRRAQ